MTCTDFDKKLDGYLDERLSDEDSVFVRNHLNSCTPCRELATAQQECQALLRTAVTDVVAAVDVSGIWSGIETAIDAEPQRLRPAAVVAQPWWQTAAGEMRTWFDGLRNSAPLGQTAWAGAAALALLVTMFSIGGGEKGTTEIAKSEPAAVKTASSRSSSRPSTFSSSSKSNSNSGFRRAALGDVSNARRLSAVRLDKLETSPGHTVSTWTQPRTKSRVIWVASHEVGSMESMR